jgi:hypothetical protein
VGWNGYLGSVVGYVVKAASILVLCVCAEVHLKRDPYEELVLLSSLGARNLLHGNRAKRFLVV